MRQVTAYWGLLLLAAAGLAVEAQAQSKRLSLNVPALESQRFSLPNGLRVVLEADPSRRDVALAVAYGVGSRDDPPGYQELAHIAEHMAFQGSRHLEAGEVLSLLEDVGGKGGALTFPDQTVYHMVVAAPHLPRLLWLESERMAFTLEGLRAERLKDEVRVVRSELRERSSLGVMWQAVQRTMFPVGHPYHQGRDYEKNKAVEDYSIADVRWLMQEYYRPSNATLVLVGNFAPVQARVLIEQYFGAIGEVERPLQRTAVVPVEFGGVQQLLFQAPVFRDAITLVWAVPCGDLRCRARLSLLERLVGGGRLRSALDGVSDSTHTQVEVDIRAEQALVYLSVKLDKGDEMTAVLQALDKVVRDLQQAPVPTDELDTVRLGFAMDFLNGQESLVDRAVLLARYAHYGSYDLLREVLRLNGADLQEAARAYLPAGRRLEIYLESNVRADEEGQQEKSLGNLQVRQLGLPGGAAREGHHAVAPRGAGGAGR